MEPTISVIIPAFNEEAYLPVTLKSLEVAANNLNLKTGTATEVLVVDNGSIDRTVEVALLFGANLVKEPIRGISRARNAGARRSSGAFLVFVDADTVVPDSTLLRINEILSRGHYIGGAVATDYQARRRIIRYYLLAWAVLARFLRMAQGVAQFVTRDAFEAVGGYDPNLYMSEDVDFYWRLQALAKQWGKQVAYLTDIVVQPSCRRFDQWSIPRALMWTNPISSRLLLRSRRFWKHWYDNPPR